jgi:hypothetical protein
MSGHSAILGGSNAARLLACPASYLEQKRVPLVDVESSYAAEGTALHEAIAVCVKKDIEPYHMLDRVFYGHTINADQVAVLEKAFDTLRDFLIPYGGRHAFKILGLEEMLTLRSIPGAFGSVDLILMSDTHVVIADWKFGGGVPVKALYSYDDGDGQVQAQVQGQEDSPRHHTAAARGTAQLRRNRRAGTGWLS